jgi:D-arabinose 1-dehydrogenase-like Zn-dependent alcohol dehydrogenase
MQVEIHVLACGVCHSDLHQQNNDWGSANYPLVVGHEVIGVVIAIGKSVSTLKMGQRVGVGPQTGHCGLCDPCLNSQEQWCSSKVKSYNSKLNCSTQPYTYGGFADR